MIIVITVRQVIWADAVATPPPPCRAASMWLVNSIFANNCRRFGPAQWKESVCAAKINDPQESRSDRMRLFQIICTS